MADKSQMVHDLQRVITLENGQVHVETIHFDDSRTQQQFRDECDVHLILSRFAKTGQLPNGTAPGMYGDFSDIGDYRSMCDKILRAQDSFMSLDAHVRKRFGNDPANLLEFLRDPSNLDEAVKLGLCEKPATSQASSNNDSNDDSKPSSGAGKKTATPGSASKKTPQLPVEE